VPGRSGGGRALLQIENPGDDARLNCVNVIGGFVGTFGALRATKVTVVAVMMGI
jgi:hypothetical protein